MPSARSGVAAAVVNNELWVFGGEDRWRRCFPMWKSIIRSVTAGVCEPNMPLPRHGIWASVIGNKIYIPGGGAHAGFAATNTNQIFTVGEGFGCRHGHGS